MAKFKENQRVQYVGTSVQSLSGKFGLVVDPAGRNGWVIVKFENGEQAKCADISLIDADGIKPFQSGARDIIDTMSIPDLLHLIHKLAGTSHPVGVDEIQHAAKLIGERLAPADSANDTVDALVQAERFISGFEGDELQEGIADMLAGLRAAIKREQAAPDMLAALINLVGNGFTDEELARRWSWSIDSIREARAAIAKAEGIAKTEAPAKPKPDRMQQFVAMVARLSASGDPVDPDGDECPNGYDHDTGSSLDALDEIIHKARKLTGIDKL